MGYRIPEPVDILRYNINFFNLGFNPMIWFYRYFLNNDFDFIIWKIKIKLKDIVKLQSGASFVLLKAPWQDMDGQWKMFYVLCPMFNFDSKVTVNCFLVIYFIRAILFFHRFWSVFIFTVKKGVYKKAKENIIQVSSILQFIVCFICL